MKKRLLINAAALTLVLLPSIAPAQTSKETQLERKEVELDKKQVELNRQKEQLEDLCKELRVQETASALTMRLEGDVLFDFDNAALRPEAQKALEKVAVVLAQFPSAKVQIDGHTDAKGKPAANLELSEKRAVAVQELLKRRAELAGLHFTTSGLGETKPIAANDTEEGRQQNRRVEVTVTK